MTRIQHSRQRHRELGQALTRLHDVTAVDLVTTPDGPVTEVCVRDRTGGLPPKVLREIASQRMTVRSVAPQSGGDYYIAMIV